MKIFLGIKKEIELIKGTNVGYDISELKNTSSSDLRNILNIIYIYFTERSRQKRKNSNYKNLYIRIKNELKEREKTENCRKIRFSISDLNDEINFNFKQTQIEDINIPNFLNDNIKIMSSTNNTSPSISTISYDEELIKEEIEKLKQQKMNLKYEMYILKKKYEKKEEEKGIDNDFNNFFRINKNQDLNFDIEPNLFTENNYI